MFDITANDISQLNDIDLRELVGRLCEAELAKRGLSPSAVTWGGNQTAADGGLDVRVALPPSVSIDGFVPRISTGFQVKKPDMPRAEIISEMRPAGTIRSCIRELADEAGAYIIVSSTGATADRAFRNRQNALREALEGVENADQLHTDFYDRTRLATWVRCYPGLITWVKEKIGRSVVGWRPYGPWTGARESDSAEYLLDDKLRLHLGRHHDDRAQSVANVIDTLRDDLRQPGKIFRLVGLSGVGKTRLAEALLDARIGARPLPPSLAVYTNLSDNPDPQPIGMASDLLANRTPAVLVVDNCPPDLHRRLSELCCGEASTISVLTIEYDVRGDHPEGTQVITLDTSSPELIEKLVRRRYQHISQVDARTIAEASGGNARIANALAETVTRSDSISGLSNDDLFQRLFRQRQVPNDSLLFAAQACSLVYSFDGEALEGDEAELPRLAALAAQTPTEVYRHVGELMRRDLVQQRGVWRAVLPHAIANYLAARALEDIPYHLIDQQLVHGGCERLARSFSRRLSFLHEHPKAIAVVERWLAPDGFLGDLTALNEFGRAMFENVAPVLPEATLAALERVGNSSNYDATKVSQREFSLLRSIAYDPDLFERCARLLVLFATQTKYEQEAKEAANAFTSLFALYLSGTHATAKQRLSVIEVLLNSGDGKAHELGLDALEKMLEATHFSSGYHFEFGARSRDYGYQPSTGADITEWFGTVLTFIERHILTMGGLKLEIRSRLARRFRGIWTYAQMYEQLERLFRRVAADGFWREGWVACRETMQFDKDRLPPAAALRLSVLEADLRPCTLSERVRAVVLGDRSRGHDLEDVDVDGDVTNRIERLSAVARELGASVATDEAVFKELLSDLLRGGTRVWEFGHGLAGAARDVRTCWARLVEGLEGIAPEKQNVQVFRGFLSALWDKDRELAQDLLDSAADQSVLGAFLPLLHSAVGLDERGVERLKRALCSRNIPIWMYGNLALGRTTDGLKGSDLKDLVLLIAEQPDGFDVALDILYMRLHSDRSAKRQYETELLQAGRDLLRRITFRKGNRREDYQVAGVIKASLHGPEADSVAAEIAGRLRQAVASRETYGFDNHELVAALLQVQPTAVLDALLDGTRRDLQAGIELFQHISDHRQNPADSIACEALLAWCERDRQRRYPLAASIISFANPEDGKGPRGWSEQAKALLASAPDPKTVLKVLIKRFQPMSWSGSRAALIETNSRLLDDVGSLVPLSLTPFLTDAKAKLAEEVAIERQWETKHDRRRDERFE